MRTSCLYDPSHIEKISGERSAASNKPHIQLGSAASINSHIQCVIWWWHTASMIPHKKGQPAAPIIPTHQVRSSCSYDPTHQMKISCIYDPMIFHTLDKNQLLYISIKGQLISWPDTTGEEWAHKPSNKKPGDTKCVLSSSTSSSSFLPSASAIDKLQAR